MDPYPAELSIGAKFTVSTLLTSDLKERQGQVLVRALELLQSEKVERPLLRILLDHVTKLHTNWWASYVIEVLADTQPCGTRIMCHASSRSPYLDRPQERQRWPLDAESHHSLCLTYC